MRKQKVGLFIALLIFVLWVTAFAIETGEIKGRVLDESSEGLLGVVITARSPNLQGTRTVISTADGLFTFPLLPVGKYTLTFHLDGFNPVVQEEVIVRLGRVTDLKVILRVTNIEEEVVVTATPPLIDKTSTDTSYYFSDKDIEKIPVQNRNVVDVSKFTPGVTGVRINTRRGVSTQGLPSFRGEGEEGSSWVMDGLAISGVRLKNAGVHINYDSIDEIQIISDPFSPEYGPAFGGIINMVTKSGSNDFTGEFSLVFTNKELQAARQEQLAVISEPAFFSNYNLFFNLGGPLVKDKLWFFLSNNFFTDTEETTDTTVDYYTVPGGKFTSRNNNLFAKLSYALTDNHNLSLSAVYHKSLGQKGGTGIPELYEKYTWADMIFRLNYRGIINATTLVEAGLGHVSRDNLREPLDGNLGPAQYYVNDLARNINNSYGHVVDDQYRWDFNAKLTKYFDTPNLGHHEINLGIEYTSFGSEFVVNFTGGDEDIFPKNGFDVGTKYYFKSWEGGEKIPTFFYEYGPFDFINSSRGIGLYFKDKFTVGRFTFMVGFRSQTQVCLDGKGEKLWSWGLNDFLAPRLSMSIDITGDGVNVLKLGWGRFSDYITTMPLGILSSGAGLSFRNYSWLGPDNPSDSELYDTANWEFNVEQKLQAFEIASNLKPNFLTRYLIQFDRRFGTNWAISARYIRSTANDLLEVLAILDPNTLYKFLYDNFEHKRRNYWGVEIELNGRIGTRFFLNASYSHASAKGTNPGQVETGSWTQEEGSTNFLGLFGNHIYVPDIPGLEDVKEWADQELGGLGGRGIGDEGWYGNLPYSVDHNFKFNTIYLAPYGIAISAAFEYISGYYWEKLGLVPFFGGYYSFPETRGIRKSPSHFYLDMGIEKEFFSILTLRLDLLNLLNSQRPISYVKENIPIFGQIWSRQQPRQARVMIRLRW
ncbi:MAG: TonB-dependent receptor [Candidatus Aminicenantes bacterium]|nr:MAG: TonB-dependent receptor [Candidatus Aminicenantes bacterium]